MAISNILSRFRSKPVTGVPDVKPPSRVMDALKHPATLATGAGLGGVGLGAALSGPSAKPTAPTVKPGVSAGNTDNQPGTPWYKDPTTLATGVTAAGSGALLAYLLSRRNTEREEETKTAASSDAGLGDDDYVVPPVNPTAQHLPPEMQAEAIRALGAGPQAGHPDYKGPPRSITKHPVFGQLFGSWNKLKGDTVQADMADRPRDNRVDTAPAPGLVDQAKALGGRYVDNLRNLDPLTVGGTAAGVGGAALLAYLLSRKRKKTAALLPAKKVLSLADASRSRRARGMAGKTNVGTLFGITGTGLAGATLGYHNLGKPLAEDLGPELARMTAPKPEGVSRDQHNQTVQDMAAGAKKRDAYLSKQLADAEDHTRNSSVAYEDLLKGRDERARDLQSRLDSIEGDHAVAMSDKDKQHGQAIQAIKERPATEDLTAGASKLYGHAKDLGSRYVQNLRNLDPATIGGTAAGVGGAALLAYLLSRKRKVSDD